jgi:hypothetical protein
MPPNQYDPNHLWTPVLDTVQWGWEVSAIQDVPMNWTLQVAKRYQPNQSMPAFPPVWNGSIPDNVLDPNVFERAAARAKALEERATKKP